MGGKVIFATSTEAEAELARAQARRAAGVSYLEDPKTEVRVHPCKRGGCGGWHLTSEETPPVLRPSRGPRRRPNDRRKKGR